MGKILSWVGLVALVWLAFRLYAIVVRPRGGAGAGGRAGARGASGRPRDAQAGAGEQVLQCAHCGVFVPASEALVEGDRAWCCSAHRDADGRRADTR